MVELSFKIWENQLVRFRRKESTCASRRISIQILIQGGRCGTAHCFCVFFPGADLTTRNLCFLCIVFGELLPTEEQIYLDLQEEARNNEYAFTLIVGYLDSLDTPVRHSGRWVFSLWAQNLLENGEFWKKICKIISNDIKLPKTWCCVHVPFLWSHLLPAYVVRRYQESFQAVYRTGWAGRTHFHRKKQAACF